MTKIAVFFANYGPYHLARVNGLQKKCQDLGWSCVGIELSRSGLDYDWQTKLEEFPGSIVSILQEREPDQVSFPFLLKKLFATLSEINPDALAIAGYYRPAMLAALGWSRWQKKATILFSDTKEDDAPRSYWKEKFKSFLFKTYQAALVAGKPHKSYLEERGMPSDAIFMGYDVVGNEDFHPDKISFLPKPLAKPYFLAVNRFIPKKNLFFLLSAYAEYCQQAGSNSWDLILCGDGQLRPQIEREIASLGLQDMVHLPGFLQQQELLPYFAHASCFIHASTQEQWGLVVNEAMASGLPVLVSNRCGCYPDLVIEGLNGFGFDPENSPELTKLMLKMSLGTVNLEKMSRTALTHIAKFSPEYFSQNLVSAVQYSLKTN